jgi:hypothetical protein
MEMLTRKFNISAELYRLDEPVDTGQAPFLQEFFQNAKLGLIEADIENAIYENNINPDDKRGEEQIEDEIKQRYEDMPFSEYLDTFYSNNLAGFLEQASLIYNLEEICIEFAQFLCFPIWYEFWKPQGIDQTRQRIENAYNMLKVVERQPISQALATINIVINSAHQTGDMLGYISDVTQDTTRDIRRAMDLLSNSADLTEWNKDLQTVQNTQNPKQVGLPPNTRNLMSDPIE